MVKYFVIVQSQEYINSHPIFSVHLRKSTACWCMCRIICSIGFHHQTTDKKEINRTTNWCAKPCSKQFYIIILILWWKNLYAVTFVNLGFVLSCISSVSSKMLTFVLNVMIHILCLWACVLVTPIEEVLGPVSWPSAESRGAKSSNW